MSSKDLISSLNINVTTEWEDLGVSILTEPVFNIETSEFSGAAYRSDGSLIIPSIRPAMLGHWRPIDTVTISRDEINMAKEYIPCAIYGGHYFGRTWGHVIIETLSTAINCDILPNFPVIFSPFCEDISNNEFRLHFERAIPLLRAAGWGKRDILLQSATTRFDRLIVPQRACVYGLPATSVSMLPEMADVFSRVRNYFCSDHHPSTFVVARRPVNSQRHHPSEENLYNILEALSYEVVDGSMLSLDKQIEIFANAKLVIGFAGSNLHNTAFCQQNITVLEIGDERSYVGQNANRLNPTQSHICSIMKQNLFFIESFNKISESDIIPMKTSLILRQILDLSQQIIINQV